MKGRVSGLKCYGDRNGYFPDMEVPAWAHPFPAQGLSTPLRLAPHMCAEHPLHVWDRDTVMGKWGFCSPATHKLHLFSSFCHLISMSTNQLNIRIGHIRPINKVYDKSLCCFHSIYGISFSSSLIF